jgi:hypothetical protein
MNKHETHYLMVFDYLSQKTVKSTMRQFFFFFQKLKTFTKLRVLIVAC